MLTIPMCRGTLGAWGLLAYDECDSAGTTLQACDFEAVLDQTKLRGIQANDVAVHSYRGAVAAEAKPKRDYSILPNSASGPEIGLPCRILAESALRSAFGRPEGRFRCFPGSSPAILPGRPIYGPEALLRNIEYQN